MSDDLYPFTVHAAPCGHSMTIVSKAQQDAFEADHRERCGADEFNEEAENNWFYDRRERGH